MQSPFANMPPVVKNLLIINVIFYIAVRALPSLPLVAWFSAFYLDSQHFKAWQPLTYLFMHDPANILHIVFNMFALVMFGSIVEQSLGFKRFVEFYFITGIGALALYMAVQAFEVHGILGAFTLPGGKFGSSLTDADLANINPVALKKVFDIYRTPILGASGAIFGILVAFAYLFPNIELMIMFIPVPVKAKYIVPIYIVLELFLGVKQYAGDSVAHFAHLGGALFGFILLKIWGYKSYGNF
ncbi:rhomboid family intramembrane serine protease [Mucilaginibacter limnophilus]|uniref:Rhomboid family intramembrane serine protease n=1 Tax=Mucilaginibacter limnophilus TaxID=1932778 RepID=A0A3S2Y1G3_9SPHI|nr:rhomboid family intramembrane serine protease [Mucilaginibacter limnophilus]RVU01255.1 rhomboid family intramembrane serine protease [Mucilaginibacter limnophilus]